MARTSPKLPVGIVDGRYIDDADGNFILETWSDDQYDMLPWIVEAINEKAQREAEAKKREKIRRMAQ